MVKLDLNTAGADQKTRAPIPEGSVVTLRMQLMPGDTGADKAFVKSAKGDCFGIKVRYHVIGGEYDGRTITTWHLIDGTTEGHKEARGYTMAKLRAIVDAIHGLDPKDRSTEAKAVRSVELAFFNNATFLAELGVEAGGPKPRCGMFSDKNTIERILRLGDDGYLKLEQPAPTPIQNASDGSGNVAPNHSAPAGQSTSSIAKPNWA